MAAGKQLLQAVLLLSILALAGSGAEAKSVFLPLRNSTPKNAAGKPALLYYGGPVMSHVKVHVIYWDFADVQIEAWIPQFFEKLVNSDFMDWMDQYNTLGTAVDGRPGTGQHIGKGTFTGVSRIKPFYPYGAVDDTDIQEELRKQIAIGAIPAPDDDTLYMIYFHQLMMISAYGYTSCRDFCAYHGFSGTPAGEHFFYGVMPNIRDQGCALGCKFGNDFFSSETSISSHEFAEAVTDPFPTPGTEPAYPQAWNDVDGLEITDICQGVNNTLISGKDSYTVSANWDNARKDCTSTTWHSP